MRLRPVLYVVLLALLLSTFGSASAEPNGTSSSAAPTIVRFAQFNASVNRNNAGQLLTDLSTPNNQQIRNVVETIQRVNPDVLLINEFDYYENFAATTLFQQNYLSVSQNGAPPIEFPYVYVAPSNTGIASGFDLDNNGVVVTTPGAGGYGNDAFGFGNFAGQFGMALFSKYPIDTANIRTFQNFLWKDMPGALLPDDPNTPAANDWYSAEELAVFRLSSKSHWDVPILINGERVHALLSHPTPPVFDGPEDRNGKRNHDEIRFWADYITPGQGDYIYDDAGGRGGLAPESRFVIMGDQNADPNDGDSVNFAIRQLLNSPLINTSVTPTSAGAVQQSELQGGANRTHLSNPAFDTADFADGTPGNLRADYVLPSVDMPIAAAEVFWPLNSDPLFRLVGIFDRNLPGGFPSSDHRLVWVDVNVPTAVLDTFNRRDGRLGNNWRGKDGLGGYQIIGKQLDVVGGGPIYWRERFGADQAAFVTLAQVDSAGLHQSLLLKVQGNDWERGAIAVGYSAGSIVVETYVPRQGWTTVGSFSATLRAGQRLGAVALADGSVRVFVDGVLLGSSNAGSFFAGKGGRIGLWFSNAGEAVLDDFSGGDVLP